MKTYVENQIWSGKPTNFFGLAINFTRYILTPEKLITRKGFFNVKEDEIMLYRLIDKRLELPLSQRIFGCGTIIVHSKDSDTPEKILKAIRHPRQFLVIFDKAVEASRHQYKVHGKDMVGAFGYIDSDGDGTPDYLDDVNDLIN